MSCGLGLPALSPLAHPLAYNNFGSYGGYPYASSLGLSALAHPYAGAYAGLAHPLAYNNFGLSSLAHPYTALAASPLATAPLAAPALF
ncbi:unnamed protein product [Brachionus calyciflorus]|uniref:Uncharacterized protein n=1 Tax=Brachionus calyciflorus TaxID=104777 RepID=A0A814K9Q2_9BILA|nr:unnamed protein product [Brachionus calyciflorus]